MGVGTINCESTWLGLIKPGKLCIGDDLQIVANQYDRIKCYRLVKTAKEVKFCVPSCALVPYSVHRVPIHIYP